MSLLRSQTHAIDTKILTTEKSIIIKTNPLPLDFNGKTHSLWLLGSIAFKPRILEVQQMEKRAKKLEIGATNHGKIFPGYVDSYGKLLLFFLLIACFFLRNCVLTAIRRGKNLHMHVVLLL